ncbi:MAG TPA: hypothetical protein VGV87_26115 [Blastocatellia bacterium]|nr:hypothetical protein [Blastocatellia bacterium]
MRRNTEQPDRIRVRMVGAPEAHGQRGLTLIEASIALLVTIVGLVSLAGLFTIAMKTNASSRNMTTATVLAQDKLEALGTVTFARLVDPAKMVSNPKAHGEDDAFIVGSLEEDTWGGDDSYYFDKIILAGRDDIEPEGTITVIRPDGTSETRRPDGTIANTNPFPDDRISYSRRWVIMSSSESEPADRRLTVAVRVKSEYATEGKAPELVDLYTVLTGQ